MDVLNRLWSWRTASNSNACYYSILESCSKMVTVNTISVRQLKCCFRTKAAFVISLYVHCICNEISTKIWPLPCVMDVYVITYSVYLKLLFLYHLIPVLTSRVIICFSLRQTFNSSGDETGLLGTILRLRVTWLIRSWATIALTMWD